MSDSDISRTRPQHDGPAETVTRVLTGPVPDVEPPVRTAKALPAVPGYTIESILGEGGMGIVYKAVQAELNRVVALKMIVSGATATPMELQRFRSEAQALATIDHPGVVRVFASGDVEGRPYLAMEYLGGGSLNEALKRSGRLPARTAAQLLRKIALGIQAAHDHGIVHRDLKPANILFDTNKEPKVTDFGLAKQAEMSITVSNAIMGTPAYMAPEQARGDSKTVGPAADVWALGVMLFECLTGARPFTGSHNMEILQSVLRDEPSSLRTFVPGLSPDLQVIVQRCLQKNVDDRLPSARDLAIDLERWLNGEPMRPLLTNTWQVRYESTGTMIPVPNPARVLEGLRIGDWDATDEVRGPADRDWTRIEDHPTFADAVSELAPPRFEKPDDTKLDMNPLIDVALVLLIFFILTTTVSSLRRSIDLPAEPNDEKGKAQKVKLQDVASRAFEMKVYMDGVTPRFKLEDRLVNEKELERAMTEHLRNTKKTELILSVDGKVPWGSEAAVHDAAKGAGVTQIYRRRYKPE